MIRRTLALAALGALSLAAPACRGGRDSDSSPPPTSAVEAAAQPLTSADMQMFLAVRGKAFTRIEEELAAAETRPGPVLDSIAELAVAERDAATALGFDWRRYRWVREEVARLLSARRQRDDVELLTLELTRARDDLRAQLEASRDPASRQFLEAQIASLDDQLKKLASGNEVPAPDVTGAALIDAVRADLAVQQGRQERIQRRVRELVQRERAGGAGPPTPAATAVK